MPVAPDRRTRPLAGRWKLRQAAGVAGAILGTLLSGSAAQATMPREVRLGHAPLRPSESRALGRLSADAQLAVLVTLKPQTGLAAYAEAVTTPGSSLYHHYLSVREFRDRFGASRQTIDAVRNSLRAGGLTAGRVSANGLSIAIDASANRFSNAFNTSFERVRLASGRVAFTNTSAPELSAAASSHIQAILGLNSLNPPLSADLSSGRIRRPWSLPRVHAHTSQSTGPVNTCIPEGSAPTGTPPAGYWTADEIAEAYGFEGYYAAGDQGAGQTIGLLELEPDLNSDLDEYVSCYGIAGATVDYTEVDGGDGAGAPGSGAGSGEAALDIEQVLGLAPQATIDVFQAPNGDTDTGFVDAIQAMVDSSSVNIISDSWGGCEPSLEGPSGNDYIDLTTENVLFEQAATEGKSVFAASGDSGSSGCYTPPSSTDPTPAVDDPASQPYVTGTGGTSLPGTGETPDPADQTVWNDSQIQDGGASGGGISNHWPMPAWQSGAAGSLDVVAPDSSGAPCRAASGDYCREVPDVSGNADPQTGYMIACSGSCATDNGASSTGAWFPVGGTSAVAPLWAAYTALVNASGICNGAPIGFANPLLYEAADSAYASDFTDITTAGNNDLTSTGYAGGLYSTGSGYSMATGLGTPIGATLGTTLCDEADAVTLSEPAAQTTTVGAGVDLPLTASDSEGHGISAFSATGLPPGLTINPATGAIAGAPTQAGRYNAAVTATASLTGAHTTKSFSWQVVPMATTKPLTLTLGNKLLTITTPIQSNCAAPSSTYRVRVQIAPGSGTPKLTFKTVGYYLDKGIKRLGTVTETVHGERHSAKGIVYVANATSTHASSSESLRLRGLSKGTHTLRVVITYTEVVASAGKRRIVTDVTTIPHRFKVC
jgi:Pro-kumamolisin, activation domain/Putative Ig domain